MKNIKYTYSKTILLLLIVIFFSVLEGKRNKKQKIKESPTTIFDSTDLQAIPEQLFPTKNKIQETKKSEIFQKKVKRSKQKNQKMAQSKLPLSSKRSRRRDLKKQLPLPNNPAEANLNQLENKQLDEKDSIEKNQVESIDTFITPLPFELKTESKEEVIKPEQGKLKMPIIEDEATIELHFENADLDNLVKQMEEFFTVTFIPDDVIQPLPANTKSLKGNKISFKTHRPLTKKETWNLFLTFLEIAGFALVQEANPKIYRIKPFEAARKSPIQAFIGVDPQLLPENDELIRYVYFVENASIESIEPIIKDLSSKDSSSVVLKEHKAFVLTDKAYNIKVLMKIIKELDKVTMPQAMSILKLHQADAVQVKELYESLIQFDEKTPRPFAARRQPTSLYFPENIRIIAESRTNALILLGPQDAINKIEDFVKKYVDVELDKPYSPLQVIQLRYADAVTIADIMNNVTQFGQTTEAGKSGGVRGIDKYLKPMVFIPEKETNRVIVKGYYDDFLMAKEVIEKLDEPQPQVAIEVLILTVTILDEKELGVQIRSKQPGVDGLLGNNVKFQTSGFRGGRAPSGIVENLRDDATGAQRLLGNLLRLATGAPAGNTILTLGSDMFGVWGIFGALQRITNAQVVSNPFLIATNKTPATVTIGERRRVLTSNIVATSTVQSFGSEDANLTVNITPQINSDGMIILDLNVLVEEFVNPTDPNSATKVQRNIKTSTIVADKEVLALGGLIQNRLTSTLTKTPVLADIPILGWLFKNKSKTQDKQNLLILISSRIVEPATDLTTRFTKKHIADYHESLAIMQDSLNTKDPIDKLYFADKPRSTEKMMENFIFTRDKNNVTKNNNINKNKALKKEVPSEYNNTSQIPPQKHAQNASFKETIARKKKNKPSLTEFLSQGVEA